MQSQQETKNTKQTTKTNKQTQQTKQTTKNNQQPKQPQKQNKRTPRSGIATSNGDMMIKAPNKKQNREPRQNTRGNSEGLRSNKAQCRNQGSLSQDPRDHKEQPSQPQLSTRSRQWLRPADLTLKQNKRARGTRQQDSQDKQIHKRIQGQTNLQMRRGRKSLWRMPAVSAILTSRTARADQNTRQEKTNNY